MQPYVIAHGNFSMLLRMKDSPIYCIRIYKCIVKVKNIHGNNKYQDSGFFSIEKGTVIRGILGASAFAIYPM